MTDSTTQSTRHSGRLRSPTRSNEPTFAASQAEPALAAYGLVKRFGQLVAVDNIDLHVPRGSIHAILGPNGAGKTTLMRMLATLTLPDSGMATVMGHDLLTDSNAVRRCISMTGQFASLDEELTGRENLIMVARLWGFTWSGSRRRADDLLDLFDLSEAASKQVRSYSGGMRRRLDIAASLIVTPGILFLDEPTTGLDPSARQGVWKMIRALAEAGVTILLTTQYLEEADQLAERISVIDHGRKIAEGSSRELKAAIGSGVLKVTLANAQDLDRATDLLRSRCQSSISTSVEGATLSMIAGDAKTANEALAVLLQEGLQPIEFALRIAKPG